MLNDFKIQMFTVELRYSPAFLIWDKSGELWTNVRKHFPALEPQGIQPQQVVFNAENRWHMEVNWDKARLTDFTPPAEFDEKLEKVEGFFSSIIDSLEITSFSRIGIRVDYAKAFSTRSEVFDYIRKVTLKKDLPPKIFDVTPTVIKSVYHLSIEDEDLGCTFILEPVSRTIDAPISPEYQALKPQKVEENFVRLTLDHYTTRNVLTDQFRLKDFVNRVRRVTHRDTDKMFAFIKAGS